MLCAVLYNRAQLPSLIGDDTDQDDYLQNTILKPGEDPQDKIRSQIFIKTTISKKACFVGEPVLVVYQLYTALYCQPKVVKQPSFNGCSVVEMTTDEPEYLDKENGKMYRVLLIRKVQLTPLQEGELLIPPAVINNEVGFTSTENPYRMQNYSAAVSSRSDSIHVKPLPADKPADYSGIAGDKFTIAAKVDSTTVPKGENDLLQITIAGEGNIEAIGLPVIRWPKGIEHFESNDSQHVNKMNFPVRGNKTFAIPFIGTQQGAKIIPEVKFTFFNTTSQQFETISTQPITINVVNALPAKRFDEHIITNDVSNKKYLWFVPGIALVVISVWLISNKRKEIREQGTGEQSTTKQGGTRSQVESVQETRIQGAGVQDASVRDASLQDIRKQETDTQATAGQDSGVPEKPDFKLLLQVLSETEDNYLFFTNAKTLLTAVLQHTLAATEQEEKSVLLLLENKDAKLAEEAKHIYAACNQYLYSPVIDDNARASLIEQLDTVISQLETT
ncbi:BatD family protein [Ilyomonas limi]|nr:BatD family protein [Ilyomonas limi]